MPVQDFHWEVMDHTKREHRNALVAKALGGCGIHNAMLYVRALESDFIKWDVEGFDYDSAMEAWKAGENYTGPGPLPEWHGRGGPISTSPPAYIDEVRRLPNARQAVNMWWQGWPAIFVRHEEAGDSEHFQR